MGELLSVGSGVGVEVPLVAVGVGSAPSPGSAIATPGEVSARASVKALPAITPKRANLRISPPPRPSIISPDATHSEDKAPGKGKGCEAPYELRWGELSGLRIGDIDLDAKHPRLTVEQTVVADKGYQRIEPPKDYEHRSIPIPAFLVGLLRAQIAGHPGEAPVFYGIRTGTWLRNHVYRVGCFNDAATSVGLKDLTPHELRHTAASLAVSAGANVKAVTLDVYAEYLDPTGSRRLSS